MSKNYLQLRKIIFSANDNSAELNFVSGVNVICGASDTGKSFLVESIDFMLGGSSLREIPERTIYEKIELDITLNNDENWRLHRSTSGGDFILSDLNNFPKSEPLKQKHEHNKTDNTSGFLLKKIDLFGSRILKSKKSGETRSLSFRDLARLIIIDETEIQKEISPFLSGQFALKTSELATIKVLLTGNDDSAIICARVSEENKSKKIIVIDEMLMELQIEINDIGEEESDLRNQIEQLDQSINDRRESLNNAEQIRDSILYERRNLIKNYQKQMDRLEEIGEFLGRFDLLRNHYDIDISRLLAIQESGSLFIYVPQVSCPLCGSLPNEQHNHNLCEEDTVAIIQAASAEIIKIENLKIELQETVRELQIEASKIKENIKNQEAECHRFDLEIQTKFNPLVGQERIVFSDLIEKYTSSQKTLDLFSRLAKLKKRKLELLQNNDNPTDTKQVDSSIPVSIAHELSQKIANVLKAWNFPGDCNVHFEEKTCDFVIDGKPRGSRGKGLRAITHAAITISLLEYCQEHNLSHPGFIVLDSPLLAYFKPEEDENHLLKGTDLDERFYKYLLEHHTKESQIIIVENQHPPSQIKTKLALHIFTGNPDIGRCGLL